MPCMAGRRRNRENFDALLTIHADKLAVDKEFEGRGNAETARLQRLLQEKSSFSLDRLRVNGGKGKKTSIRGYADYDLVIYLNGENPPYAAVLTEINSLIVGNLGVPASGVKQTPYSLTFDLNGVHFDLLPARNVVNTHNTANTGKEQVRRTLDMTKNIPDSEMRYHSSDLTEGAVAFIKSRSHFVHRFVRLAKNWNLGVDDVKMPGRSTMIETIAVDVAERVEASRRRSSRQPSLRHALDRFLVSMRRGEINVAFDYNYPLNAIPKSLADKEQKVMDPTNPRNDLLPHGLPKPFKTAARRSLAVMNQLNREAYGRDLLLETDINRIF